MMCSNLVVLLHYFFASLNVSDVFFCHKKSSRMNELCFQVNPSEFDSIDNKRFSSICKYQNPCFRPVFVKFPSCGFTLFSGPQVVKTANTKTANNEDYLYVTDRLTCNEFTNKKDHKSTEKSKDMF